MILTLDIAVLADHEHMVVIQEWQHAHALAECHHPIDGSPSVRQLGNVFAQLGPFIGIDRPAAQCFPGFWRHSKDNVRTIYQTTRHVSVLRTPTAPAMPVVTQLPSDCMSGLSTNAIRS